MSICWDFPRAGTGNEQGYSDAGIEMFKGMDLIDNLVREICQNSLDAKASAEPVIVSFDLREFVVNDYAALSSLSKYVARCKRFWGDRTKKIKENEFIHELENVFADKKIKTLVISDYNTRGLTGINAGHDDDSAWRSLTSSDGSSEKENDTSGGNFGIGKNAPFACSTLKTVFYNTRAIDGGMAFQGTAKWISMFDEENKNRLGVGHYIQYKDDSNWGPVCPEDDDMFARCFERKEEEYGTDVIILGFNGDDENWQSSIINAVLKNFFVAIVENKLTVRVGKDIEISSSKIKEIVDNLDNEEFKKSRTEQLFYAYSEPTEICSFNIMEPGDVTFRIKINENYDRITANFRNNGMLIEQHRRRTIPVFAAVLVVNDVGEKKLSKLLREAEPPRHNVWDYKRIKDNTTEGKYKRKECRQALDKIKEEIIKVLDKYSYTEVTEQLDGGIGEFLSVDTDNGNGEAGTDRLRIAPKMKLGSSLRHKKSYEYERGESGKGQKADKPTHKGGRPKPHPKPTPKPVNPIEEEGEDDGVKRGEGKMFVTATDITAERTFPVSSLAGIYKTIIMTSRDYDNIYLKISAAREDNKEEKLKPVSVTQNNVKKMADARGILGPLTLKAGNKNELFISFNEKEDMALSLLIMEEVAYEEK